MKIAVFGWYGHNNAGDERIKYCLGHFLENIGGVAYVHFYDLHDHAMKGKTNKFDEYDLVIIGGGGLIFSQCNYHDFINGINTKIVTLGISVEMPRLIGNAKEFAISLLEKSFAVLVRDTDSAQKLSEYDFKKIVKVSSDLTFLKPYDTVDCVRNNNVGINLLPKPAHLKYSTLAFPAIDFLLRQLNRLGIVNLLKIVDFGNLLNELKTQFSLVPIPLYCDPQSENLPLYQKNDVEFLKCYFKDVPTEFTHELIDRCSMFLSMRLHGTMFAVQKGIPVLSLSYLPKNMNFMKAVGLEEYVTASIAPGEILGIVNKIQTNQHSIREKMNEYTKASTRNIQEDVMTILNLVK